VREKNRNSIASCIKLPQFTTMNVIDGQAGFIIYSSLIFYSLTIDNILNIIVLLILAGVTIATLTGDNGLLQKAANSKQQNKQAEIKERIQLAASAAKINGFGELKEDAFNAELTKEFGSGNYELLTVGKSFLVIVENIEFSLDRNGNISDGNFIENIDIANAGDLSKGGQYDGVTEETAYRVTCVEDLLEWTNNYNKYLGKNIKLGNTIDFNSTGSYKNYKAKTTDINGNGKVEELITELTTGTGFKPISNFSGTFDGQNNEIRNIYEDTTNAGGLFSGIQNCTLRNLTLTGEITSTNWASGFSSATPRKQQFNCYSKLCK